MSDVKPIDGFDQKGERGRPCDARARGSRPVSLPRRKAHLAMEDCPGFIGLRLDCGDGGHGIPTKEQARDVIAELQHSLWEGREKKQATSMLCVQESLHSNSDD